jgi:hypothetical protein
MSNILTFDQFKEGYIFEQKTLYRENIESLNYLDSRFDWDQINEGWFSDTWDSIKTGASSLWKGLTGAANRSDSPNWSLETVLHTVADLGGIFGDFIFPGLGTGIDIFHAGVYFLQSYLLDDSQPERKEECFWFGLITLVFAVPFLNPLQLVFKPIGKGFVKLMSLLGKGGPDAAKLAGKFMNGNKPLKKFVEKVSNNLDGVEKELSQQIASGSSKSWWSKFVNYLKKGVEKIPWLDNILKDIGGFFTRMKDLALAPFRKLANLKVIKAGTKVLKSGFKISAKAFKFLTKNTVGRLYNAFMKRIPGFTKIKKIGMFDEMFEKFIGKQNERGFMFVGQSKGIFMRSGDDFVMFSKLNKGSNTATVVMKGAPSSRAMKGELRKFWGEKLEDFIKKNPGQNWTPMAKGRWITNQVNGSTLKNIKKADFIGKFYKSAAQTLEKASISKFKVFAGLYKFLMGPIFDKEKGDGEPIEAEEIGTEEAQQLETLSEEQADEMMSNIDMSGSDIIDGYQQAWDNMTEEERSEMGQLVGDTQVPSEDLTATTLNINTVIWQILAENDSSVQLPDDNSIMYSDYSWPLSEFKRRNGVENDSNLDESTIKLLISKTSTPEYSDYLTAYLNTLSPEPEEEEEDEEENTQASQEDEESKNQKNKKSDTKKSNSKPEKQERRQGRIKSFDKFLVGAE